MKSAKNIQDKDLLIDVDRSIKLINRRGKYPITFHKPFDYAGTEQYKSNKEQHPEFSPGPQHYWKSKENVVYSGQWTSNEEREESHVHNINGISYAFFSYTTWTNGLETPAGK